MRRQAWTWIAVVVVVSAAGNLFAEGGGTVRGTVSAVVPSETPDGKTVLTVVLKGEGIWQAMLTVGPENKDAYAVVLGLKPGERVTVGWTVDAGRNVIREIVRSESSRKEGEPKVEAERTKPATTGDREAYERARNEDRERKVKESLRLKEEKEAQAKQQAVDRDRKEGERPVEGERRDGEGAKVGPRDGERKEVERRVEGNTKDQRRTYAKVVSVEGGEDGGARVLKLQAAETGEETTFTVGADRGKLYEIVGNLKAGNTVQIVWRTEAGKAVLLEIGTAGSERKEGAYGERKYPRERE